MRLPKRLLFSFGMVLMLIASWSTFRILTFPLINEWIAIPLAMLYGGLLGYYSHEYWPRRDGGEA